MTRHSRPAAYAALLALPLGLAACPGLPFGAFVVTGSPSLPPESPTGSPSITGGLTGGRILDDSPQPATPRPSAAPVGASPTPTAQPTVVGPFVIDMVVEPNRASIGSRPPAGATPFAAFSVQLQAQVTLSNGLKISGATWQSADTSVAEVDSSGLVTAGYKPGETFVVATSRDGQASASARITVVDAAGLGILLE